MAWRVTRSLAALGDGFNTAFPLRLKDSDGSIGDEAHQDHVSGHNPDDTAGSLAEYSDLDDDAEVRAIDVDKDLRAAGVSMMNVISRILATPADVARLAYIIFCPPQGPLGAGVPTIWSRNNGWSPRPYTGSNRHVEHAHFSGTPSTDEDGRPWSVAQMGVGMEQTDPLVYPTAVVGRKVGQFYADTQNFRDWAYGVEGGAATTNPPAAGSRADVIYQAARLVPLMMVAIEGMERQLTALQEAVDELAAGGGVPTLSDGDHERIVADVKRAGREGTA